MLDTKELLRLKSSIETNKSSWDSTFYDCFAYAEPERNYIYRQKGFTSPANQKQVDLFTSAGRIGTDVYVARLQNKLCPYKADYIQLIPKESLEDQREVEIRNFGQELSNAANERKNELKVDSIINQSLYDLAAGTACILSQNTTNGLSFTKIPLDEIALGTEQEQTVCRRFKIAACRIWEIYPELMGKTTIGGFIITESNKYDEVELNDMLYYNTKTKIYEYYVLRGEEVILQRSYKKSPFHIFHWARAADMPFGNGVIQKVLPNIKRLNKYIKSKLELIPFAFPMFFAQNGTIMDRNVNYKPGAFIFCQDPQKIVPIQMGSDTSNFRLEIQTEEIQIKEGMLDTPLPSDLTNATATEINAKLQSGTESFTANVARLTDVIEDIAWKIVEDVFNSNLAGVVDFNFDFIRESFELKINNDAQIDNVLIQKIQAYVGFVGQFDPKAIYQSMPRGESLAALQRAFNLPPELTRTGQEIDEAADQDAQAQAEMAQAQVGTQMAMDTNKAQAPVMARQAMGV